MPAPLRWKARAILQSVPRIERRAPSADAFEVCVLGHLRDVKDPLRTAEAARLVPAHSRLRVLHAGEALTPKWAERARAEALELLARSRLLVVTSRSEGGANVISEALAAGVPVVSSRIDGSVGLLGADHPGYFPAGDTRALAALLQRCEEEPRFLDELTTRGARLAPLFDRASERAAWQQLLDELSGAFQRDVAAGLDARPRHLSCRYFYDPAGSRLFEEICALPEYYLTRAERQLLEDHAPKIVAKVPAGVALVELGSGSAVKTRLIIDALLRRQPRLRYLPIDISPAALQHSARELERDYPALDLEPIAAEYEAGLRALDERLPAQPRLILWLGSNIGNLDRDQAGRFLATVRARMTAHDRLLVGVDLRKARAVLEPAYDDAAGVTARFNRNLLERINRELGGQFDPLAFAHRAHYDERLGRVEMYLVSTRAQEVPVRALGRTYAFAAGEALHTENSYKYSPEEIDAVARAAGLSVEARWLDREGRFCECLLKP